MKEDFIKAIEEAGVKNGTYKLRYVAKGKYGKPEVWLYPKNNPKRQKMNSHGAYLVYASGSPVMESQSGILIELETIEDKQYLKDYLDNCFLH